MNWFDIFLLVLLAGFMIEGLRLGFTRVLIGIIATVLGLLLGAWFYGTAGAALQPYLSSKALANAAGFLVIFLGVQLLGALAGWVLSRLFKWTGLGWLDRLLGAFAGALKAALAGIVFVLIITAFPLKPVPDSIAGSRAAPYLIEASHILVYLCPRELRDGFVGTYDRLREFWNRYGPTRKPPRASA